MKIFAPFLTLPTRRSLLLALGVLCFGTLAFAQSFPIAGKPVRIVVPFPPGGQTDIQARALAAKLTASLGVPVLVENRPGASTIIGAQEVVKSPPDGHTLLYTIAVTASQNPHLYSKLPFDPLKDLTPVMLAAKSSTVMMVAADAPYNTVQEFVAYAKANPSKVNFGSFSTGSTSHLNGELLKQVTGIDMVHIPYKGSSDANMALFGGHIQMMFDGTTTAIANAKGGKVKILGYVDKNRLGVLPDVPTMAEAGVPGIDLAGGMQFFGPAALPPDVLVKVNAALVAAMRQPDIVKLFTDGGTEVVAGSPEGHAAMVRDQYQRWGVVIRRLGLKLD